MDFFAAPAPAPAIGFSQNAKIIICYHGLIINPVKQNIYFPYNRLIYYVNKGHSLMAGYMDNITRICNGKSTTIKHKIPIANQLETYPQLLTVNRPIYEDLLFIDKMGIYICDAGNAPEKLYSWRDLYDFIYNEGPIKTVLGYDGVGYPGILLEELLNRISQNPRIAGANLNTIDINIYACRSICNMPKFENFFKQNEQVSYVGDPIPGSIYGGNGEEKEGVEKEGESKLENVDEEEYFKYLSTCEMPPKKIKGGYKKQRKSKRKQRKQRKTKRKQRKTIKK